MANEGETRLLELCDMYGLSKPAAKAILNRLNQDGWTVYRKRVMVNPRRRAKSIPMSPKVVKQIKHLHKTTNMTQQQIANAVGVNAGRVNEVLHG